MVCLWQGMEDPALVMQLDTLYHPSSDQVSAFPSHGGNSFDLVPSLESPKQKESQKLPNLGRPNYTGFTSLDGLLSQERPQKMLKPTSLDTSMNQYQSRVSSNSTLSTAYCMNTGNLALSFGTQHQQQHRQPHLHQQYQQLMSQHLDGYAMPFPQLQDHSVAPRTPTNDIRSSFGSVGQESCTTDAISVEGVTGSSPVSSSDSMRKRKAEFLPLDLKTQHSNTPNPSPPPPVKSTGHTQDHIMAERKRREKLSQRFIALSAIVPGLKKVCSSTQSDCVLSSYYCGGHVQE